MATREEVLSEAYRRGIMPPDVKVAYEEAARRGLHGITLPGSNVPGADTTVAQPAPTFPTQHPIVQNDDGSTSNVLLASFSADIGGSQKHFAIPTMVEGRRLTTNEAFRVAKTYGLDKYPSFDSQEAADAWIMANHGNVAAPKPAPDMVMMPQERPQIGHPLPQGAWEQDLTAPMPRHRATQQLQQYLDQIDTELPYPDPNPPPQPLTIGLPGPQSAFAQPDLTAPPPLTTPSREIAYEHARGGAEVSWIQPAEVGAAVFGTSAKIAYSVGAKLMPSFVRGLAAMIPAGVMEFPIGQAADLAAESGNPELALLLSVGLGFGSSLTVERLADAGLLKAVTGAIRAYPKVAKATLPQEVFAKLKGINVAVGERGALGAGPLPPRPVEAPKEPAPTFYSQLEEVSEKKLPGKMFTRQAMDQIDAMVKKGEVKAEEVDTTGVKAWLESQGDRKVTKAEVMDYLRQNKVELEETVKRRLTSEEKRQLADLRYKHKELADYEYKLENFGFYDPNSGQRITNPRMDPTGRKEVDPFTYYDQVDRTHIRNTLRFLEEHKLPAGLTREEQAEMETLEQIATGATKPKFSSYTLPGGENYRERLIEYPGKSGGITKESLEAEGFQARKVADGWAIVVREKNGSLRQVGQSNHPVEASAWDEALRWERMNRGGAETAYTGGHWDEPNVLMHTRTTDRTDAAGKKVLFLEEVQSDLHQQGKKRGYKGDITEKTPLVARPDPQGRYMYEVYTEDGRFVTNVTSQDVGVLDQATVIREARRRLREAPHRTSVNQSVPDAPFKKTWPLLGVKRALREAAEGGYDQVAWTTGAQQAERYDLSKQVDAIRLDGDFEQSIEVSIARPGEGYEHLTSTTPEKLEEVVGKEIAEKAINQGQREFKGVDLKVGGEGMKRFYDDLLVREVNKYVKKWGGKVGESEIGAGTTVHSLELTPELREAVLTKGQPMFSVIGAEAGFEQDEDGNLTFDPEKAILGIVGAGIAKRLAAGRGKGKFLRAEGRLKGKDPIKAISSKLAKAVRLKSWDKAATTKGAWILEEWDGVSDMSEAIEHANNMEFIEPILVDKRQGLRYQKNKDTYAYGNAKMAYPNKAYPEGRNTYDFQGCGREAFARKNGLIGEGRYGRSTGACYGGACYAETMTQVYGGKEASIAASRRVLAVDKELREEVRRTVKAEGLEAAQKKWPDLVVRQYADTGKITVKRMEDVGGVMVSTNLQPASGQDIRLGVDTDGAAWLSRPDVMDALLKADPRTLTVYSAGYHTPPGPHPLSDRTIVNVTVSGWHPLPETLHRLKWARIARDNGWNVILREVVANPKQFTNEEVALYNRVHDMLLDTDFFVMQQPLHKGASHSEPMWDMPSCCWTKKGAPHTCDRCEVSEGLGTEFRKYWGIKEEPEKGELTFKTKQLEKMFPKEAGAVLGVPAGLEEDEEGELSFDPKKALVGMLAVAAGKKGAGKARWLGARIVNKWDAKVADPIIEFARRKVNGAIWNEDLRHWFGLNRSKKFGDLMRDYNRDFKQTWVRAREIAEEIAEIAPTKLEQQRFRQILKGSVTASSELTAKAQQLNKLFTELKDELKAHDLLRYSQFDKATDLVGPMNRKERARIARMLNGPDPETLNLNNLWWYAEKDLGLDPQKIIESRSEKRVLVEQKLKKELGYGVKLQREQDRQVLLGAVQRHLEFQRSRLRDYYQVGSAEEYFPLVYDKHEGLTPKGREKIEDELKTLRRRSRFGNPEGRQDLEETIAELEEILKKGVAGRRAYRTSRKQLVKGYSHRRVDLPIAIQRQMGLIEEAAFPIGKAYGVQATDILKAKLFEQIADEGSWAYKAMPGVEMPANYHLVEDEKFGALNGLHVRKDVWDDLREVEEWRTSFVRGWDYLNGVWKGWHTVWNPATHARNTYWNVIAASMGDVPITDLGKAAVGKGVYFKAGQALKQGKKNVHYQEAQKWGLLNNTFYSSELNKFRDELEAVRDGRSLKSWIRTVMSAPGKAYEGSEKFFKMAVFIKAREDGLSVDKAGRKAEKVLFNYSDIPPIVKHAKRWAIPFLTFSWKFWPMMGEMAIRRPHKVLALLAMGYGLEEFGRKQMGMSDEEAEAERKLLPPWQRRRVFGVGHYLHVLMPFPDKWGNHLYWDLSTILPYAGAGEEAGQSGIPMADLMPVQNPLLSLAYGIVLNRESFTGKDIYDKTMNDAMSEISELANEALKQRIEKQLAYAWKQIGPPIAPSGYNWSKLKTGLANTLNKEAQVLDWADRPYELREAVLSGILGIKLTPADEKKLKEFETYKIRAILKKFNEAGQKLRRQAEKNEITKDEYKAGMRQFAEWERLIVKERAKNLKQ